MRAFSWVDRRIWPLVDVRTRRIDRRRRVATKEAFAAVFAAAKFAFTLSAEGLSLATAKFFFFTAAGFALATAEFSFATAYRPAGKQQDDQGSGEERLPTNVHASSPVEAMDTGPKQR